MEPEARYAIVGSAVLILVALLVGAVLWLRSTGEERDDRRYKIYFQQQSLEGLQPRSEVKMKGIRIGTVSAFRISSARPGAVEVLVSVDGSAPVRQTTEAVVERHLITGIASIRLLNPSEDSPLLTQAPQGEAYPVIAEGESQLQQFSESVTQLAQRTEETLRRINAVFSPQNERALTEVLQNLQRISANADRSLAAAGGAADEVRALARDLRAETSRLAARYDTLGAESSVAVREIAASMRQLSADATHTLQRVDALLASGDVELRVTARELRATADSLGAVARRLNDPRSILFGPPAGALGPGEGSK
jgi:phospholipid/cholesterol/gamma-HCH transport system substrate-binding protein